jgi:hypothetical protein
VTDLQAQGANPAAIELFEVAVNPIAAMFCTLLNLQVQKGLISKSEAKQVIASAVEAMHGLKHHDDALITGTDMLMRMITAIDAIPTPVTVKP